MTLIRRSVTLPTRQRSEPSRTVCGPWLSQFTSPPVAEQARKLASSAPLTGSFLHSLVVLARLSGDSRPPTTRTLVMPSTSRPRRFQTPGRTKRCASLVPFTPAPNHRKHPFRPKAAPRKKPRRAKPLRPKHSNNRTNKPVALSPLIDTPRKTHGLARA